MKKILIFSMMGLFALNTVNAQNDPTKSKARNMADKDAKEVKQGVKHGTYDATHNKLTKKTNINNGNEKYANSDAVASNKTKNKIDKGAADVKKDTKEGAQDVKKGVKHGAYDATHNKVTKETKINDGNQKYDSK